MTIKTLVNLRDHIIEFLDSNYDNYKEYEVQEIVHTNYFIKLIQESIIFTPDESTFLIEVLEDKDKSKIEDIHLTFTNIISSFGDISDTQRIESRRNYVKAIRDKDKKILYYTFTIFKDKNLIDCSGEVDRETLDKWIEEYTTHGMGKTAAEVALLTSYTTLQFRKILIAFNVFKSTICSQHQLEERTSDEIVNDLHHKKLVRTTKNFESDATKRLIKSLQEQIKEKDKLIADLRALGNIEGIQIVEKCLHSSVIEENRDKDLVIFLSDWHIGARVDDPTSPNFCFNDGPNTPLGDTEVRKRLHHTLNELPSFNYNTINIVILGDMIDGINHQTTRGNHYLPETLGTRKMIQDYGHHLSYFITKICSSFNYKEIFLFTVASGNHEGFILEAKTESIFKSFSLTNNNITYDIAEGNIFGHFKVNNHLYCVTHGKDAYYQKRGFGLNLNDKDKNYYLNHLLEYGFSNKDNHIHFVKGDLHQDNLQQITNNVDIRTVASLFGASDYSAANFSPTDAGTSYEIIEGDNIVRGQIKFPWL